MPITMTGSRVSHQGWTRLLVATFRLPDGREIEREIEDHGPAASVLPYNRSRRTAVIVRQFRAAAFVADGTAQTSEAIAGILDRPDPPQEIRREALEEAGLVLDTLEPVGSVFVSPGISTERAWLFLGTYTSTPAGGSWSVEEGVTAIETPLAGLAAQADSGTIGDLKTLALVQTLRLRHPELFL
jgi:nudix-type nucleoside diphosphatase (YffH/AdpP family)